MGKASKEIRDDSIKDWREEEEKGEDKEGELIRVSDNFRDKICTQERSLELLSIVLSWLETLFKQLPFGRE